MIGAEGGGGSGGAELERLIRGEPWFVRVLETVRAAELPDAWVGAGVLRDLVWGMKSRGFDPADVADVDVAFFDADDLSPARDARAQADLRRRVPDLPWEATNQAAVHTWYATYFGGGDVEPLRSTADGVATWPETATAVAVRLADDDRVETCAPYGLEDLLGLVWRPNWRRVSAEVAARRLREKAPTLHWPGVRIMDVSSRPR
jgi:uncharacterized protein